MALVVGASTAGLAWITDTAAAPQQLDCVLTDTSTQPGSEGWPVVVVFDEDKKTLSAEEGRSYSFINVLISNVSINGQADDVSLGIDRSSLGIVWQQYGADNVRTDYGDCHPRAPT